MKTSKIEKTYGNVLKIMRVAINPFKKVIVNTECQVHKFINMQALNILKNDNFKDAYVFFSDFITELDAGVTWADQDLKSMGHFYNPFWARGLFGNSNANSLAGEYYNKALSNWRKGDVAKAIFFLGASIHLVQDMTVPQHANIKLLDSHKRYETFIKKAYLHTAEFVATQGGYYYMQCVEEAIKGNARNTITIYSRLKHIEDEEKRFFTITKFILPLAQRTTAGCLMMFYKDVFKSGRAGKCRNAKEGKKNLKKVSVAELQTEEKNERFTVFTE